MLYLQMMLRATIITLSLWLLIDLTSSQCQHLYIRRTISYDNCIPRRFMLRGCNGYCNSYTSPSLSRPGELSHHCQCCQDASKIFRRVRLICPNPIDHKVTIRVLKIAMPTECSCRPCSVLPRRIIPSEPDFLQRKRSINYLNNTLSENDLPLHKNEN